MLKLNLLEYTEEAEMRGVTQAGARHQGTR